MTAALDLTAPIAMTKGEAVSAAHVALTGVVRHCLDLGLEPDALDKRRIREAHDLLTLVLKGERQ